MSEFDGKKLQQEKSSCGKRLILLVYSKEALAQKMPDWDRVRFEADVSLKEIR